MYRFKNFYFLFLNKQKVFIWILFYSRMKKELIKESASYVAGKPAEELVMLLDGKKYMNEFLIAKKLGITINQVRNILYRLSEKSLVSSTRKKDKKKGWYTYSWKNENLKSLEFLSGILIKRVEQMNFQIQNRETKEFYVCSRCSIEFNEENALLHDFMCPECGDILERKDNSKVLKAFKRNVEEFRKKLEEVNSEIDKEKEKIVKKRPVSKAKKKVSKKTARKAVKKTAKKSSVKKKTSKTSSSRKSSKKTSKKKVSKKTVKKTAKKSSTSGSKKKTSKKVRKK